MNDLIAEGQQLIRDSPPHDESVTSQSRSVLYLHDHATAIARYVDLRG
jgi:hypothetical protein